MPYKESINTIIAFDGDDLNQLLRLACEDAVNTTKQVKQHDNEADIEIKTETVIVDALTVKS